MLANIWFFNLGYISGIKALQFAQDFKLAYYCGVGGFFHFFSIRSHLTYPR